MHSRYRITGIIRGRKVSRISRIWKHSRMFSCTFLSRLEFLYMRLPESRKFSHELRQRRQFAKLFFRGRFLLYGIFSKAFYTHYAAHHLNLCVMKCCSICEISNMTSIADSVVNIHFNHSSTLRNTLMSNLKPLIPKEKCTKLKELC